MSQFVQAGRHWINLELVDVFDVVVPASIHGSGLVRFSSGNVVWLSQADVAQLEAFLRNPDAIKSLADQPTGG